ncbi:MAG: NAD(P)H-dependent oxidoreductase subunit E [Bacillales bacterium]|nr:NAD(P)H-dependent oxidoreductase subunit E [Bacillales bacterium]
MKVVICVGSSCHLKGSHEVLLRLQELISENKVEDKVELAASFCLGQCAQGVSMIIDGKLMTNANKDTIDSIFNEQILPYAK